MFLILEEKKIRVMKKKNEDSVKKYFFTIYKFLLCLPILENAANGKNYNLPTPKFLERLVVSFFFLFQKIF